MRALGGGARIPFPHRRRDPARPDGRSSARLACRPPPHRSLREPRHPSGNSHRSRAGPNPGEGRLGSARRLLLRAQLRLSLASDPARLPGHPSQRRSRAPRGRFRHPLRPHDAPGRDRRRTMAFGRGIRGLLPPPSAFPRRRGARRVEYRYRLTRHEPYWHLERASCDSDDYGAQYRFTTAPRLLADYRGGCEYHQKSPDSTFTQKVVATRALEDGRVTVTRDRVILRQGNHRSETPLADEKAWYEALARHLGIHLETV